MAKRLYSPLELPEEDSLDERKKSQLVLHICCAPCAGHVIAELTGDYEVIGYFFNPNIYPEKEFELRLAEVKRLLTSLNIALYLEDDRIDEYNSAIKGLEDEPEGGARCEVCFRFRLDATARFAKENQVGFITTTMTVSPHKNASLINKVGIKVGKRHGISFLEADFKKKDGYKKSCLIAKEYGFYRQQYCGCKYSYRDRFNKLMED